MGSEMCIRDRFKRIERKHVLNSIPLNEVYQENTSETIALDQNASGVVVSYMPHRSLEVHKDTARRQIVILNSKSLMIRHQYLKYSAP